MKHGGTLPIFLFLFSLTLNAQDTLLIKDVFDYNIGDEFQTVFLKGYDGYIQTRLVQRITILNKYFSSNIDTVYYVRYIDEYYYSPQYQQEDQLIWNYSFRKYSDTLSYSDLDSTIFYYMLYRSTYKHLIVNYFDDYHPDYDIADTLLYFNNNLCGAESNGIRLFSFSTYLAMHFTRGLGFTEYMYGLEECPTCAPDEYKLFYYKKNNIECGSKDLTFLQPKQSTTDGIIIYPNPTNHNCRISIENYDKPISVELYNSSMQLISRNSIENGELILYMDELPKGLYYVKIKSKNRNSIKKLIKY